jgi:integrase
MKLYVDTSSKQVTVTKDPTEKVEQNGRQKTERNTGRPMWSTQVFVLDDDGGEWIKLQGQASEGPVPTSVPTVSRYMNYWLREVVRPNLAPKTYERYEAFTRLHIVPYLGTKQLDKLQVRDLRQWLNKLAQVCQCCAQGKDAARPQAKRRCCAIGQCCHAILSARSRADARDALRAAYTCAVEDELISRNPVAVIRLPAPRTRKRRWWTVDDARRFLESTRAASEPLYAAFVLILVLGLRKGEVLGLTWELVNLDAAELHVGEQVQRVGRELLRRQVKTETSEAPLPLPELCVAALKLRREQQEADRGRADGAWIDTGLVFTTRHGTTLEPRNFSRSFDRCITKAQVPRITVHGTRKTCGSLLAALDVHPRVAMQILRHSKIAVTMEIYTEVPSAATRDALKKLGQWLGS